LLVFPANRERDFLLNLNISLLGEQPFLRVESQEDLPAKIELRCKWLTNTLAYYSMQLITTVKSFTEQFSWVDVGVGYELIVPIMYPCYQGGLQTLHINFDRAKMVSQFNHFYISITVNRRCPV
jgi:hypothetical protein